MKYLERNSIFLLSLSLSISGCIDFNSNYDSDNVDMQDYDSFVKGTMNGNDIDEIQMWNASVMSTLNISLNLDKGENYSLKLFTQNPLFNDSEATVLAEATCIGGESSQISFAKPQGLKSLFLVIINSKNRTIVEKVDMNDVSESVIVGTRFLSRSEETSLIKGVSTDFSSYAKTFENLGINVSEIEKNAVDLTTLSELQLQNLGNNKNDNGNPYYVIPDGKTLDKEFHDWNNSYYIVRGTWNCKNNQIIKNAKVILMPGSKMIINNDLQFNSGAVFYNNKGTIQLANDELTSKISMENSGDFYNNGIINLANGTLSIAGNNLLFYNSGEITLKYLNIYGECTFYNNGHLTAESTTSNNNDVSGQNNSASNFNFVNGCYAKIDAIGVKHLIMCNNSRLDCTTGIKTSGASIITMGKYSVVNSGKWIDGGAKYYASENQDEYSVFKLTSLITNNPKSFATEGYLYFDCGENFRKPNSNEDYNLCQIFGVDYYNNKIEHPIKYTCIEKSASITIPKGDCSGDGYNADNASVDPMPTTPTKYYYAFEDMGGLGDYDFNDVVVSVEYPVKVNNETTARILLEAVGGVLPVQLLLNKEVISSDVHKSFDVDRSVMVNTWNITKDAVALKTITASKGFDPTKLNISIIVNNNGNNKSKEVKANNKPGKVPQMICVSGNWKWAKEGINISNAYSKELHSFGEWGANYNTACDWYSYPDENKVVTRE